MKLRLHDSVRLGVVEHVLSVSYVSFEVQQRIFGHILTSIIIFSNYQLIFVVLFNNLLLQITFGRPLHRDEPIITPPRHFSRAPDGSAPESLRKFSHQPRVIEGCIRISGLSLTPPRSSIIPQTVLACDVFVCRCCCCSQGSFYSRGR